ncbi:hypothetical protein [Streptomyces sp. NPDC051567]
MAEGKHAGKPQDKPWTPPEDKPSPDTARPVPQPSTPSAPGKK